MINTKFIVTGGLFAAIAAMFQLIPVFLTEMFVFFTIFSTVPIYIVSRINPKAGVLSYLVAGMIVMILSIHEGIFFLCTNGIVGLSLGICSYYIRLKTVTWFICSIILTITLSIMNYGIGIPVFGGKIPGIMIIQIAIIFAFSFFYNVIYYFFCGFVFDLIKKSFRVL